MYSSLYEEFFKNTADFYTNIRKNKGHIAIIKKKRKISMRDNIKKTLQFSKLPFSRDSTSCTPRSLQVFTVMMVTSEHMFSSGPYVLRLLTSCLVILSRSVSIHSHFRCWIHLAGTVSAIKIYLRQPL